MGKHCGFLALSTAFSSETFYNKTVTVLSARKLLKFHCTN